MPLLVFSSLRDSLNIRLIGAWPYDFPRQVYPISHSIVYLAVGHGIWIYNTTNPQNPIKIGEIPFIEGRLISEIERKDNLLYVAHLDEGFSILDITNPIQPQRIGYVELSNTQDIYIQENNAYIIATDTFFIYNVSNPRNPIRISATPIYGGYIRSRQRIFVLQNYAYLGITGIGLLIYDISNPSQPREIGRRSMSMEEIISNIWIKDTFAYISIKKGWDSSRLKIFSVSNPRNIYQIGEWRRISEDVGGLYIRDSFAYFGYTGRARLSFGLDIINIANPRSPSLISNCSIFPTDIIILDSLIYVSSYPGLGIINIKNPHQPVILCHYLYTPGWILGMETFNNFAFLSCFNGISVIDFSNLSNPRETTHLCLWASWCYDIAIKDTFLYTSSLKDSLLIINIANPYSISLINSIHYSYARALFIKDTFLYMAHSCLNEWTIGFSVWKITNPASPILLGYVENEDADAYGVFVKDSFAYVGDGPWDAGENYGGFRIFNIANPYSPYQVYHFVPNFIAGGATNEIFIKDTIAFVCDDAALFIFNVSNPNNPRLLTYYEEYGPSDILVIGNLAYLADGYFGIRVLDISDVYNIQQLGYYKIPGFVHTLRVMGRYILACLDHGGFYVFEYYGIDIEENQTSKKRLKLENFKIEKRKLSLNFSLPKEEDIQLEIINNLGKIERIIKLGKMKKGEYSINLNLSDLSAGMYFIRLKKEKEVILKKLILLK
ncbi:MAG: T9SS type A sorting domain-containing protein [candidate division WOR-3 bacterium]|nr:T9SS type A sorting domain-containing protein [candidate division WOR-3 bacterium]